MATGVSEDWGQVLLWLIPKDFHMAISFRLQGFCLGVLAQPAGRCPEQADGQQNPGCRTEGCACQAAGAQGPVVVSCPLIQYQEFTLSNALQLGRHHIASGQGGHTQQQKEGPGRQADLEIGRQIGKQSGSAGVPRPRDHLGFQTDLKGTTWSNLKS